MSITSSINFLNKINCTSPGIVIGVGIALIFSGLVLEAEMNVGIGFGLALGA